MAEENDDEFDISFGDDEFGLANSTFNSVLLNENAESSFSGAESEADPDDAGLLPPSWASTPKKTRFKEPKLPPPKYFKKCVRCGEYLKTEHGFVKHQKTHRWKDAVTLKPSVKELISIAREKVPEILDKVMSEFNAAEGQPGHLLAVQVKSVVGDQKLNVENSEYLSVALSLIEDILAAKSRSKAMPSALRFVLQCELSVIYSKSDITKKLFDSFLKLTSAPQALAWNVIFIFLKKLMDFVFNTMCVKIRGPALEAAKVSSKDDFNHYLSQQTVNYVSGACLRAHFRNAYAHPKNTYMKKVKECILEKFATVGLMADVTDRKSVKYWTSIMNRKSLLFLHEPNLPFFIALSKLLQKLESADGSLHHTRVMDAVTATPTMTALWDSIVGDYLSDDESFRFMKQVIKSLTNTFGKGVMLRRMNAKAKTAHGNKTALAPSFRARLIGK